MVSADRDRKRLLCGFAVEAFGCELHRIFPRGGIRVSEGRAIGGHSVAEIPMTSESGDSVFRCCAGELDLFAIFA